MKLNLKKLKKPFFYTVGIIILIYSSISLYSLIFEQDKLAIDRYNFTQLEKAIPILESMPKFNSFYGLKKFNERLHANIQPIENCYYISNYNGNQKYIFGFQLKSKIYQFIYFGSTYSYPSYNIPYSHLCTGVGGSCLNDGNKERFDNIVSGPCIND